MATLKELMGDLTRGDGRKLRKNKWAGVFWFEPIFKDSNNEWFGLNQDTTMENFFDDDYKYWLPFDDLNEKKKVTLYRPIVKEGENYILYDRYCNNKDLFHGNIVGWQEMEVEVDE